MIRTALTKGCFCLFGLCPTLAARGQAPSEYTPQTANERELIRLEKQISAASETDDSLTLNRLMRDDFLLTYTDGRPDSYARFFTKRQLVARWSKPPAPGTSASTSTVTVYRVQVSGNTGIIHARIVDVTPTPNGTAEQAVTWVSDVWVKHLGRWRWLSSHESALANP